MRTEADRDAQARRRALDPAHSFIVQAPAGSGKTSLLTQRYLRLLATVEAPEQIVAITFTRKAAAEMRLRILDALRKEEHDAADPSEHDLRTQELARAAREHGRALGWELEAQASRLRIQTIDAFSQSLARRLPVLARAGADLAIAERPQELYRLAARRSLALIEEGGPIAAAVETLLRHRDNQLEQTEELLIGMLGKRDQWLALVLDLRGPDLRAQIEADLQREITAQLERVLAAWPAGNLSAVLAIARQAADGPKLADSALKEWCVAGSELRAAAVALPVWRELASLLLNQKGQWRQKVDGKWQLPAPVKTELRSLITDLAPEETLRLLLSQLEFLPPPRLETEQWAVLQALIELLKMAASQLELVFRETGQVDYSAVGQAALRALGDAGQPTDLAIALDEQIRHLLVDEFQDSSERQLRLFEALTAGWSEGDGRTVFFVGDPMQSIYRFRQAEVGLFLRARDHGIGALRPLSLVLERNFRSQSKLVDWFNAVFPAILPAQDDLSRGAVRHAASVATRPPLSEAAVTVHAAYGEDPVAEADEIATLIAARREQMPQASIGVLVRHKRHVAQLADTLKARGLGFQAVELEELSSQPVVRDLMALSRALLHAGDRTAWLAILRAPWCGLSLSDLLAVTQATTEVALWALANDEQWMTRLSSSGQRRLRRVWAVISQAVELRGRLPLRAWVERAWLMLGGAASVADERALDDAAAFFDRLEQIAEIEGPAAGEAFEQAFADLQARADPQAPPQLQLMTIHKAKGLEFDIVILPGLGRGRGRSDRPLLRWLEIPRIDGRAALLLAPIGRKGSERDALEGYLKYLERERADLELARLLYVAVTRASREIHLFGHVQARRREDEILPGQPASASLLALLWPEVRAHFDAVFEAGAAPSVSVPTQDAYRPVPIRRLAEAWQLPRPPTPASAPPGDAELDAGSLQRPEFDWVSETSRHVGTVVHGELERWSELSALPPAAQIESERNRFRRNLGSLGVPTERLDAASARVVASLAQTLADQRGRWLFDPAHRQAQSELALSGLVSGQIVNVVIDRSFLDEQGRRWIIDYKTSSHEGADRERFLDNEVLRYRQQLERYARLMAELSSEPLRIGLYFPLLQAWREWTPAIGAAA